jgi:hypothetical protein
MGEWMRSVHETSRWPHPGLVAIVALGLAAPIVQAETGRIGFELTTSVDVEAGRLRVPLAVRNVGDTTALAVSPTLAFRGHEARAERRARVEPGATFETVLELETGKLGAGRWPYRVTLDYTDANDYPFQALQVAPLLVGEPAPPRVAILDVTGAPVASSGSIEARLKNLGEEPRQVHVHFHVPAAVEVEAPETRVDLDGWEERTVSTDLVNRTGLPGSRYAVFATAEYEDGEIHQTAVASGTLDVIEEPPLLERYRTRLLGAAALLVLGWAAFVLWRRTPRAG